MDNHDIKYFLEIVKTRNFSKAAENLCITQPGISRRINMLEEELGIVLFKRSKGQTTIEMTDSGQAFFKIARQMDRLYESAAKINKEASQQKTLRIAIPDSVSTCTLPSLKRIYNSIHPEVLLSIITCHSEDTYEHLRAGHAEIGIVGKPMAFTGLAVGPLYSEPLVFICGKNAAYPEKIKPDQLNIQKQMVLCNQTVSEWQEFWFSTKPEDLLKVNKIAYMDSNLFENDYWAVLPISIAHMLEKTAGGRIHEFDADPPDPRTIYLVLHSDGVNENESVDGFVDCLKQQIRQHPDLNPLF